MAAIKPFENIQAIILFADVIKIVLTLVDRKSKIIPIFGFYLFF